MNYIKIYNSLISNSISQNRTKNDGIYYELHHIKPKSLFPDLAKVSSNLVLLTPREHYLAHWMLTKIYPSRAMNYAFLAMCNNAANKNMKRVYKVNSKVYEKLKLNFSKTNPAKTKKAKDKISKAKKGPNHHYYQVDPKQHPSYKKEEFTFIHKNGKKVTGTREFIYSNTDMTRANVSNLITGYRYSAKGWQLKTKPKPPTKKGTYSSSADLSFYCFHNKKLSVGYVCTRHQFLNLNYLKKGTINKLITKERNSAFGWIIDKL